MKAPKRPAGRGDHGIRGLKRGVRSGGGAPGDAEKRKQNERPFSAE
jgi:hypothetical protein